MYSIIHYEHITPHITNVLQFIKFGMFILLSNYRVFYIIHGIIDKHRPVSLHNTEMQKNKKAAIQTG